MSGNAEHWSTLVRGAESEGRQLRARGEPAADFEEQTDEVWVKFSGTMHA